ncbi:hypothetical protein LJR016_002271 [Devosia sp. LjRoot16]|uniref:hypothetical protein n=1 Tax=Devosia sp. LjRoot16 TaxID=3342271 RepID=UPI003ECDE9BD
MAIQAPAYSRLFSCIHDEPGPVGNIGRGTHYSIFRAAEWHDVMRRPLPVAQVHDFAVIWDEDHDTRVIEAIEKLYMRSLLSPVQFIGERKGGLSVILAAKFYYGIDDADLRAYQAAVETEVSLVGGDYWSVEIGSFDRSEIDHQTDVGTIIQDTDFRAKTYLRNIDALWHLGTRNYVPPPVVETVHFPTESLFAANRAT